MSDFVEQTRLRFEQMFRGHRTRLSEVAARWRPEMDQLAHRVVELVCMDGRISPIMPYGLAPIVPIAGGVPQDKNNPYQEWLKRNVGRAKKEKGGLVMVFCNTRRNTDLVARNLKRYDIRALAIIAGIGAGKIFEKITNKLVKLTFFTLILIIT